MSVIREKYSPGRIDMLNRILMNDHSQGQPRDYEIKVDGLKVVQRTNDPERFFQHEDFLQSDTVCLSIAIYEHKSRNCIKYDLYLRELPEDKKVPTLDGIETMISEKLETEKRNWKFDLLVKENEELREELAEAEEYHETLAAEIEELKNKKPQFTDILGHVASFALQDIAVRNADKLKAIPALAGIAGLLGSEDQPPASGGSAPEGNASFQKRTNSEQADTGKQGLTPEEEHLMYMGKLLYTSFNEEDLARVVELLKQLAAQPHLIEDVLDLVNDETENDTGNQMKPDPNLTADAKDADSDQREKIFSQI